MEILNKELDKLREEFAKYPFKSKKDEMSRMKTDPHFRNINQQWEELAKKRSYPHPKYGGCSEELKIKELDVL